ncbi:hypothetical protein CN639_31315 [Bacillus toyonensis]|nr:hypothetical protein CN639_31315 [Bacillus toyonensis]
MISEFMTKTRFTINVNVGNIIHFILILFGLGINVAGFSTSIFVGYEFSFYLCIVSFIFVSLHFVCMYFILYIFTREKK